MMRRTINLLLMLLFVAEVTFANTVDFDKAFKESARIEKQIKRTSFPKRTFLITDFGAKTDDEANPCHEAINQAILQCSLSGGGTVIVPKGTFYTGPITLKLSLIHISEPTRLGMISYAVFCLKKKKKKIQKN